MLRAATLLALLLTVNPPAIADPPLPTVLVPYSDFLKSAQLYHSLRTGGHWETLCDETFTNSAHPQWRENAPDCVSAMLAMNPNAFGINGDPSQSHPIPRIETVDGVPALVMDAPQSLMQVAVGPPVRSDMAIEIIARPTPATDGNSSSEMTLVFDGIDIGPGFRFGCNQNTANELWIPRPPAAGPNPITVPFAVQLGTRRLQHDGWNRIRIEIRGNTLSATVDGDLLGSARLPSHVDVSDKLHQANIFTCHGSIAIRQVLVQHYAILKHPLPEDQAWQTAFGSMSHEEANGKIDALIDLMEDDDPQARDIAQQMLIELGDIATPRLIAAAADHTEVGRRAGWITSCEIPTTSTIPPLPPQLEQFRQAGWMFNPSAQLMMKAMFIQSLLMNND